jgi:sirohydrochlorin cobaltochelatase
MSRPDFSDAALVLLGHGTELDPQSSASVYQHAAELRRRSVFAEVREAFWKQDPRITDLIGAISAPRVLIVPLFMSEGYFAEGAIPRELGFCVENQEHFSRTRQAGDQKLVYCLPVGTHDKITEILMARATEVVTKFPFPRAPDPAQTSLFIAGHGTEKDENSRRAVERHVGLIRSCQVVADVKAIFLEEYPRIGECYWMARTKNLVIVPFFISDGLHVRQDIPLLLGESKRAVQQRMEKGHPTWRNPTERNGKRVWYSASVGTAPQIAEIIMLRVIEASEWDSRPGT